MKTIIKLLIVGLIANAAFQAGRSYYERYNFTHDVHMETLNGGRDRSDDIQRHILEMAAARGHAMTWDDIQIEIDKEFITIEMEWEDTLELVPRFYSRPWPHQGRVHVRMVKPIKLIQ